MKKVGFFLKDINGLGGIARVTSIISNLLCEEFEIYILADFHSKEKRYEYSEKIKISFLFENLQPVHKRFFKLTKGIKKFIKENDIDILICAGAIYYPPCVYAVKGTKTKLICWEHSNVSIGGEHKFQGMCRKIGAKNASYIVPLTKTDEKLYIEKYGVKNCKAIYNPIDDKLLCDVKYNSESKKIISVGRLCHQKNFENLVDVAEIILKKYPEWVWHIYGEGNNRESIETKIGNAKLNDKLILMGRVDDLYERYDDYSILVMTSRFEGFPMTLLESTAKGIPSISYDILTGPNEIIEEGKTGYLIEPENITRMAEKIECLILDKELRETMSQNNISKRDNYSCENIKSQWIELLNSIN